MVLVIILQADFPKKVKLATPYLYKILIGFKMQYIYILIDVLKFTDIKLEVSHVEYMYLNVIV